MFVQSLDALLTWVCEIEELKANQKPPSSEVKVVKAQLQEQRVCYLQHHITFCAKNIFELPQWLTSLVYLYKMVLRSGKSSYSFSILYFLLYSVLNGWCSQLQWAFSEGFVYTSCRHQKSLTFPKSHLSAVITSFVGV